MQKFFLSPAVQPQAVAAAQLCIAFDPERAARASDPETSKAAARRAVTFARSQAGKILAALRLHGPMSPKQMFAFTGLDVAQCDRRRKEMIEAGLVRIAIGEDGKPATHEGCEVWEAVA